MFINYENKSDIFSCFLFFFLDLDVLIRFSIVHSHSTDSLGGFVQKKELTRIEKENMYNRQTGRDNIYGDGI